MTLLLAVACLSTWSDHFDGTTLQPHWGFYSEGSSLHYNVSGGYLNVTGVSGPFQPDQVMIYAQVGSYQDFVATASVEWDPGKLQSLAFEAQNQYPIFVPRFAEMSYSSQRGGRISAFLPGANGSLHAPKRAAHTFRISRAGSTMSAFFDGRLVASTTSAPLDPVTYLTLTFEGDEAGGFGGFRIDRVAIEDIPSLLSTIE